MAKSRKPHVPDPNVFAFSVVQAITGQPPADHVIEPIAEKNAAAVELGRRGGSKGGKARAAKMTKAQRSEAARKAAKARWGYLRKS